jgi:hypothetical protein
MIEYTGNIKVDRPERRDWEAEGWRDIEAQTKATINRLQVDQNNPDGAL